MTILLSYYLTNTDSLVYEIETNDVYEDFYENKNFLAFSDYPENSKFFYSLNKRVIGQMNDEVKEKMISEFVGLKPKSLLVIVNNNEI